MKRGLIPGTMNLCRFRFQEKSENTGASVLQRIVQGIAEVRKPLP